MALSVKVSNFAQPTATNASFAVTGVGFKPKALILFATDETGIGVAVNISHYMGMATSSSNRAAISAVGTSATSNGSRSVDNAACFAVYNSSGTEIVKGDLVSFDSDGFTINFSTVDLFARVIGYVAIGGADLTNAFIKEFQGSGSTGNVAYTGVGFKPDALIMMSSGDGTTPPSSETTTEAPMVGFADTAKNNQASLASVVGGPNWEQFSGITTHGGSMHSTVNSYDSDGFTLNYTGTTSTKYNYALCLKGGQYHVGVFNQPSSTGNNADVTGLAFQPTGVLMSSVNQTSTATDHTTSPANLSFGAASGPSNMMSIWNGGTTAGIMDNDTDTGEVITLITAGASPTTNAKAELVSFDSAGFTDHWTNADSTAREIVYFAMGSNANTNHFLAMMGVGS